MAGNIRTDAAKLLRTLILVILGINQTSYRLIRLRKFFYKLHGFGQVQVQILIARFLFIVHVLTRLISERPSAWSRIKLPPKVESYQRIFT